MQKLKGLAAGLSGVAGEYFVAAELSRRGYIATVTLRNAKGIDILASNATATRAVGIQVKTNKGSAKKWILKRKAELLDSPNLFYVFVNLNGVGAVPSFHVVESHIVATHVTKYHKEWLAGTKKDGSSRKDTNMRAFHDAAGDYENAWERLGLDAQRGSL